MKRLRRLISICMVPTVFLMGCSINNDSESEEIPDTTEQVVEDAVVDYDALSISELEVLAYEGDAEAMYKLGLLYEYGSEENEQSFDSAFEWYEKASLCEYVESYTALGYFYLNGVTVDKDLDLAEEYFLKAIDGKSINANVGLARVYLQRLQENGDLDYYLSLRFPEELDEEDTSLEVAGSDAASSDEAEEESDSLEESEEVVDDTVEAVDDEILSQDERYVEIEESVKEIHTLFRTAQVAKDMDATYYIGYLYENGIDFDKSTSRAINYYKRVINAESSDILDQYAINMANTRLGLLYIKGQGVEVDYEAAMEYFTKAAENSYAPAMYYLGQIYENGIGLDKDYEEAMNYYLQAAEFDYAPALNQIGYMYYNGYGVDVNFSSAVYYQKLAALQGYAPAQVNLGYLYENGYGVEQNLQTALSYYELASEAGYEGADEAVVRVRAQLNNYEEDED